MKPKSKVPCKFKGNCKNYKAGQACEFSHDKCKYGKDCKDLANCRYFHQQIASNTSNVKPQSKFDKPMNQTQCKYGMTCKRRLQGKCFFKHTIQPNIIADQSKTNIKNNEPPRMEHKIEQTKPQMCPFGQRCNFFSLGKCPYKHQQQRIQSPAKQQNHLIIFDNLCLKFLTNYSCDESCSKLHEYSQSKSISKIFTAANCGRMMKKIMILEHYMPDQQPLYIILGDNRIIFGQLTNLAKESGNQNIGNNSLVMKRWYDWDISFEGDNIINAWIVKAESSSNERADLLVLKCSRTLKIIIINRQKIASFPFEQEVKNTIFINNILLVLTTSRKTFGFQLDFSRQQFKQVGQVINEPLNFINKYHKSLQGQEFAAGVLADGRLCFINKQLKTYLIDLKEKITDVCFSEYEQLPVALCLTQNGKILGVNLLTFQSATLLNGNLPPNLICSSVLCTMDHLIIAIDGFGVLAYNYQQFSKIIGVLALGNCKWSMESNQRGNIALMAQDSRGNIDASIFKLRRL